MAAPILWTPGIFGSFSRKTFMPRILGFGRERHFYFNGREDFCEQMSVGECSQARRS